MPRSGIWHGKEVKEVIYYRVMAGRMFLGITPDYEEALRWAAIHDGQRVSGPFATIREVES